MLFMAEGVGDEDGRDSTKIRRRPGKEHCVGESSELFCVCSVFFVIRTGGCVSIILFC